MAGDVGPILAPTDSVPVAHIAYTERNVLMLDGEGVCVRVEPLRGRDASTANDGALRCIGAQYVASIDPGVPGGLVHHPRVGTSMLFAAVDPTGRIFCVRAGPLTHFESAAADDSGVHSTPNDTQKRASAVYDDTDATDPGFGVPADDDGFAELETTPYPSRRFTSSPSLPRSGNGGRPASPPPTPRLPRLQSILSPRFPQPPQTVTRPASQSGVGPPRASQAFSPGRGRPPSPSSHAWLRDSVAVAGGARRR